MKKIAIQGYKGAFHQEAAENYFGKNIILEECASFECIVKAVNNGHAEYGIMAIENSLVGCILPNFVLIRESGLSIVGEAYLQVVQNLMALPHQQIEDLREVKSHPMAIMQCKPYFNKYPKINLVDSIDTALSAKQIFEQKLLGIGAIGSKHAASIYGLEILASSIETHKQNFTRFVIIAKQNEITDSDGPVKATIAFTAQHKPGSLVSILSILANEKTNLTMLQSLPVVGTAWEYIFHADLCYQSMEHAHSSMAKLSKQVWQLWVMGIYPSQIQHNNQLIVLN